MKDNNPKSKPKSKSKTKPTKSEASNSATRGGENVVGVLSK